MLDQLIIGNKASLDDFDASLAARKFNPPKKKSIKESVPYSNVTYDFSDINGEVYWEERPLECVFEITAPTPEDLEQKKTAFFNWVMNVTDENIIDTYNPDYHYKGTFSDITVEDDESIEKTTITVVFSAYPYKIANLPTVYKLTVEGEITKNIINASSHRITPTIITDTTVVIKLDDVSYSMSAGEFTDSKLMFKQGVNTLTIESETECNLTVKFFEEVF